MWLGLASRDDYVLWWCEVRPQMAIYYIASGPWMSIEAHNRVRADLSQPQWRSMLSSLGCHSREV